MSAARIPCRWLQGKNKSEFLQFANGRITRRPLPLGGYHYDTTHYGSGDPVLYSGDSESEARAAISRATGQQGGVA